MKKPAPCIPSFFFDTTLELELLELRNSPSRQAQKPQGVTSQPTFSFDFFLQLSIEPLKESRPQRLAKGQST